MLPKLIARKKAISLRQKGYSYSEIASKVLVSKSSLSIWLKNIVIDNEFQVLLEDKKRRGQLKGANFKKNRRLKKQQQIINSASKEIRSFSKRDLWLAGIMAYWCEGSKQRDGNVSQAVVFSNSDPLLLKLFIKWLIDVCSVSVDDIYCIVYIHETGKVNEATLYWSKELDIPVEKFGRTILKKHNVLTNRKYKSNDFYYGQVRICVKRSTNFNRKIAGWIFGINKRLN